MDFFIRLSKVESPYGGLLVVFMVIVAIGVICFIPSLYWDRQAFHREHGQDKRWIWYERRGIFSAAG